MISSPKTPVERLLWAYQSGHSWNRAPEYANLRNLDSGRIQKMNGDEADARLLIASWQDFEPNVARLVAAWHGRELEADGDWGPASEFAVNIKRCAMPDFAPPAGAELSLETYDIPELLGAIQSYQKYAAFRNDDKEFSGPEGSWSKANAEYEGGTGSWPGPKKGGGCDPTRKDVHSKRCNILTAGFSSHQKAMLPQAVKDWEACEAEVGMALRHVMDGAPTQCEHDLRGQNIPGNVIGFNYFPDPDTCNQVVVGRIDNTFNVDQFTFDELGTHEKDGHGDGCEHVSRQSSDPGNDGYSIMHPSIGRPNRRPSWLKDRSFPKKRSWYGGIPVPTDAPPPPPPPPPTGVLDTFTLAGVKYEIRKAATGGGIEV